MKKISAIILAALLVIGCVACGEAQPAGEQGEEAAQTIIIGVPNDPTNEARALALLEAQGIITLKKNDAGVLATVLDIESNPYNAEFKEIEAAQLPNVLPDLTYAVINSNYAIEAGLTPFVTEGTDVSFPNIIAVKEGNEESAEIKALVAAVNSEKVKAYIEETFKGAIVCDLNEVGDGFDATVDYAALDGATIKIASSPTPHAGILKIAKEILAEKNITLDIVEFNDYVQPNNVVESGEFSANYFQHVTYLENFNAENNTHIVSVLEVHHEPMGVYSPNGADFSALSK